MSRDLDLPRYGELEGYIRADEHLRPIVGLLGSNWRPRPGLRAAVAAVDDRGAFNGTANVDVNYTLIDRAEPEPEPTQSKLARNEQLFRQLAEYWRGSGYRLVTDRASPRLRILRVAWPADGFEVSLRQGKRGNLWITVTSPPVRRTRIKPPPAAFATGG